MKNLRKGRREMAKAPAFQLYAADFYMDTASWSPAAVGFYFRLLMYQWVNGGVPKDLEAIARITGCMETRKWRANVQRMWLECGHKFAIVPDANGGTVYKNFRLEEEREKQKQYKELQSQKGKSGAEKRWVNNIAGAIAEAMPAPIPNDSSSSSSSSSYKDIEVQNHESSALLFDEEIKILEETEKLSERLYKTKKFPKINAFLNWCIKENYHPQAIHHTLKQIANNDVRGQPWAYGVKIIKVESQNFTERDHFRRHDQLKKEEKGETQATD